MTVTKISTMEEYDAFLEVSKTKLCVCDFSATWCGPCRYIHPIYEKMAADNPDVAFAEVDVDEAEEVAGRCSVRAMPTFHFYKNGEKIAEVMGADQNKLLQLIAQHK